MLMLYNTMARDKQVFTPRGGDQTVRMFSCGPSIYRPPHLGNYRSFVWQDVLQRYLEYSGFNVQRLLNFTDVEDKAIEEAQEKGITIADLTRPVADRFMEDASRLRIKLPEFIPRSSTSVDQAARLIRVLLDKGYAYWHQNNVFFEPLKFKGFGRLFRLDMSRWPKEKRRFKKDTYHGQRWNLGDFILWHGHKPGDQVFWDTEIGRGRPSWNIQDPAIVTEHLGYTIDIACGGIDNLYRHHDYNIAVIEAASGKEFARFWVHGEHLLVDGKKMSKSVGNIVYPQDLMTKACTGQHIRFYLLYGHHRRRLNFTAASFRKSSDFLEQLRASSRELIGSGSAGDPPAGSVKKSGMRLNRLRTTFQEHMDEDLNVQGAIVALGRELAKLVARNRASHLSSSDRAMIAEELQQIDQVLQVIFPK